MLKRSNLAKLSQPNIFGVVGRIRLFYLLNEKCNRFPVIWIKGPPGAGKTSLVASYLEECKRPAIWYQIDSGDSDLATFFYFMKLAGVKAAPNKTLRLPYITPEYLHDLPEFFRRFFRKFFAQISENSILILDNYQEIVWISEFHNAIQCTASELPKGMTLIVISHLDPPTQFARLLANNFIGQINWEDLRLTLDEIEAIIAASASLQFDDDALLLLQKQTNGWAAGLVLLLERFQQTGEINNIFQAESMESIFYYFASQFFDKLSADTQELLMSSSFLPHITVKMATTISKNLRAKDILDSLYRRRLFIDRRLDAEISYQYHALFREFLMSRAKQHFSRAKLLKIRQSAAALAEENGRLKAAAGLYAETQSWKNLIQLICRHALALIQQGRNQTLLKMIGLLPKEVMQTTPWLLYWYGISISLLNPRDAIAHFEQAFTLFQNEDNNDGQFLACAAIMDVYIYIEDDMSPVLAWADRLQELLTEFKGFPSLDIEARVLVCMQGLIYAAPHHPLLESFEKQSQLLLEAAIDPFLRFGIACTFIWLPLWRGNIYQARKIIEVTNLIISTMDLPSVALIRWRVIEAAYAWSTTASYEIAENKIHEGLEISQESGISILNCMQWGNAVYSALAAGNLVMAKFFLNKVEATIDAQGKHTLAEFRFLRAGIDLLEGNLSSALDDALASLKLHERMERPFLTEGARFGLTQILIEIGEFKNAHLHLEQVIQYSRRMKSPFLEHQCLLIEAHLRLQQGEEEQKILRPLEEGLQLARENDYLVLNLWWRPQIISRLLSLALKYGIEENYVHSVIRRRNIKPYSLELDNWPWKIKIYTLGSFDILCDNISLRSAAKTRNKPLELLKLICSCGGQTISQDRVIDHLWPDSEGDIAEQTFRTTLHRLRKLLKNNEAVRLEDRYLFLDLSYVWIDCLAFDRVAHHSNITDRVLMKRAITWYRGHFLEGDASLWALTYRDRLRAHYRNLIMHYGLLLERDGNWPEAIECYLKAIEFEPTIEIFYYHLMKIYSHLDRRAEALAIYQRCRQILLTRMGISPTKNIQTFYETLIDN